MPNEWISSLGLCAMCGVRRLYRATFTSVDVLILPYWLYQKHCPTVPEALYHCPTVLTALLQHCATALQLLPSDSLTSLAVVRQGHGHGHAQKNTFTENNQVILPTTTSHIQKWLCPDGYGCQPTM